LVVTTGIENWWTLTAAVEGTGAAVVALLPGGAPQWPESAGLDMLRTAERVLYVDEKGTPGTDGVSAAQRRSGAVWTASVAAHLSQAEASARWAETLLPKEPRQYGADTIAAHFEAERTRP